MGNFIEFLFDKLGHVGGIIVLVIVFAVLSYGGYKFERWVNWNLAYGDDVKSTVCEMVKPEYLKNPDDCK